MAVYHIFFSNKCMSFIFFVCPAKECITIFLDFRKSIINDYVF